MNKLTALLLLLILWHGTNAQRVYTLGEAEYDDSKEGAVIVTYYSEKDYPNLKREVDLSFLLPPAGDQGTDKLTCWAWATTYAIRSYLDNTEKKKDYYFINGKFDSSKVYSPAFTCRRYMGKTPPCLSSNNSDSILDKILKDGAVHLSDYSYAHACDTFEIPGEILINAKNNVQKDYDVIHLNDLYSVKKILSDSIPLVISIRVDDYFATEGNITIENPIWSRFHKKYGTHAMVCAGYSDSLQALLVLNSWGRQFGRDGYAWISYDIVNAAMNYSCYPQKTKPNIAVTTKPKEEVDGKSKIIKENKLSNVWFSPGYFIPFDNMKIALASLENDTAVVEIRDNDYLFMSHFVIGVKSSKEFSANGKRYIFYFDRVDKAGGRFKLFRRNAVWFDISKKEDEVKFIRQ